MAFFLSLLIEGALSGTLYALVALAFVIVYKASRVINFALGEWLVLAALLVAAAVHALRLDLVAAIAVACAGMCVFAWLLNTLVLRPLVGQPVIALLMVTLGIRMLVRGVAQLTASGVPTGLALPIAADPLVVADLRVPAGKLAAAVVAGLAIALIAWFHQRSRTGVALRAMADDQQVAMAMGVDVERHLL